MSSRIPCTKVKGDIAEGMACSYLVRHGYRIVERNFRCRGGEIDIVAEDGDTLCIVEVRSVASAAHGGPLETVNSAKQKRLVRAAQRYLTAKAVTGRAIRFDVVGVVLQPKLSIALVRGAFVSHSGW